MARNSKSSQPAEPPQRRNRAGAVGLDAPLLGRAGFERAGFFEPGLVLRWKEIVGPEIARLARPLKLGESAAGGVLTLAADPAAAIFLQHQSRTLCERVNAYLGRPAVRRLRFVPGEIGPEPLHRDRTYPQDPAPDDPARKFAGPDHLKQSLLRLARVRAAR